MPNLQEGCGDVSLVDLEGGMKKIREDCSIVREWHDGFKGGGG